MRVRGLDLDLVRDVARRTELGAEDALVERQLLHRRVVRVGLPRVVEECVKERAGHRQPVAQEIELCADLGGVVLFGREALAARCEDEVLDGWIVG
jgi:hypothetical protein